MMERWFGTLRARVARLVRKTYSFSKDPANHLDAIRFFIVSYNLAIKESTLFNRHLHALSAVDDISMHLGIRRTSPWLLPILVGIALLSEVAGAEDVAVYSDQAFVSHWSDVKASVNSGGKPYHGPFGNQPVSLTLDHLPQHRWIKATFDLYIIGSWDGSSPVWGPDLWSFSVRGAQRLIFASFCGWGYAGNDEQSYPDDYPNAIHRAWTGAVAHNVVDIQDSEPPKNGMYKVEVLFPHTEDQIILDFAGAYVDPPSEQQVWGIGNVEVHAFSAETMTGEDELPVLWQDLASEDSVAANKALWRFVGAGAKAVSFLKEKVGAMDDDVTLRRRTTCGCTGHIALSGSSGVREPTRCVFGWINSLPSTPTSILADSVRRCGKA